MQPSPIRPRSLRKSVVGVSQSQTWKAKMRFAGAADLGFELGIPPDVIDIDGDADVVGAELVDDVVALADAC